MSLLGEGGLPPEAPSAEKRPLNRDNAFIIAALSFIPTTPDLGSFFYAFCSTKGSIVVGCRSPFLI